MTSKTKTSCTASCSCSAPTTMTFSEAKRAVRKLKLRTQQGYVGARISKKLPAGLPQSPSTQYAKQWKGWADFLGVK